MTAYVHWVKAGDPAAARKHGLSLLAECGLTYVPDRRGAKSSLSSCAECEAISGPINRRAARGSDDTVRPHFVYRHYDEADRLLYVGCTVDLKMRHVGHQKSSWWFPQSARVRVTVYPSRLHALRVERNAIRTEMPLWNVRHQDFDAWGCKQLELGRDLAERQEAPAPVLRRFHKLAAAS